MREASKRVLGLRPFDVQLIGGMVLHNGQIAEMKTGEGKTLVAVLPAYLNALAGKGVQVSMFKQSAVFGCVLGNAMRSRLKTLQLALTLSCLCPELIC